MTELLLFISTFAVVFFLGLQSLNVNNGHYVAAFFTSFAIGGANLALFKLAPNATGTQIAAYLSGGPIGIVCAMWFHKWFRGRLVQGQDWKLASLQRQKEAEMRSLASGYAAAPDSSIRGQALGAKEGRNER